MNDVNLFKDEYATALLLDGLVLTTNGGVKIIALEWWNTKFAPNLRTWDNPTENNHIYWILFGSGWRLLQNV